MNSSFIQLLVLAGVAIFLVIKLRAVLGTRDGFEKPIKSASELAKNTSHDNKAELDDDETDHDINEHVTKGSAAALALAAMKGVEPAFSVTEFLRGGRQAYEMILMAFENGDITNIKPFLSPDITAAFQEVIDTRQEQGIIVEAKFIGLRGMLLDNATFDDETRTAEITLAYTGELTTVARNAAGEIVEGHEKDIKRQHDFWTFARIMGADNPNWQLVATGGV